MYICTYRRKHLTPSSVFREHSPAGYVEHATGTEENSLYVRGWQKWNIGEILKEKQEEYQDCHTTGCCYVQTKNVAQVVFGWGLCLNRTF